MSGALRWHAGFVKLRADKASLRRKFCDLITVDCGLNAVLGRARQGHSLPFWIFACARAVKDPHAKAKSGARAVKAKAQPKAGARVEEEEGDEQEPSEEESKRKRKGQPKAAAKPKADPKPVAKGKAKKK